jgi:O-antigen/teichoic acid export membrane protein
MTPEPGRPSSGRLRSLIAGSASVNLLAVLFGVTTSIVLSRALGPTGRGDVAAVQVTAQLFFYLGALGLPTALAYFVARAPTRAADYQQGAVGVAAMWQLFVLPVAALVVVILLPTPTWVSVTYLVSIPVLLLLQLLYQPYRPLGHYKRWNLLRLPVEGAWLVAVLVAAATGQAWDTYLVLHLVVLAGLIPAYGWFAARLIGPWYHATLRHRRELLAYGIPSLLTMGFQALQLKVDQLFLVRLVPTSDLGLYVAAVGYAAPIVSILNAVSTGAIPGITGRSPKAAAATARKLAGLAAAASLGLAIVGALAASWLIPLLFGEQFEGSVTPAVVLCFANAVLGFNFVLQEILRSYGRPRVPMISEVIGLLALLASIIPLVRSMGFEGAAVASLASYGTSLLATVLILVVLVRRSALTPA